MVTSEDVEQAAAAVREALGPALGSDRWEQPAGTTGWSCRRTLDHLPDVLLLYAGLVATRSTKPRRWLRDGDAGATPRQLLGVLGGATAVLARLIAGMGDDERAYHPTGMADRSGWAAMACDELLVHGDDIAAGLGVPFAPDPDLADRVVRRLFPWAPTGGDRWAVLRWANGRQALPDRPALAPDWTWWGEPLEDWTGTPRTQAQTPGW